MRIADIILPEDRVFFDLFRKMTINVREIGRLLSEVTADFSTAFQKCHAIRQLEHECDGITRMVYERLDESLITPLEPEEIARLAEALDNVVDSIDWVAHQICNYGLDQGNEVLKEFSDLIGRCTIEIENGVVHLSTLKAPAEVEKCAIEINRYWNSSRDLLSSATLDLFKKGDPIWIIKFKDIYENLEQVLARCNNVGHVLSDISRRHA
ncbi:MAG: DUF47 family protein [Methanomicrobiales archaeon]|nr:DUF47 family protein [Methanomicrobiales archaeon]